MEEWVRNSIPKYQSAVALLETPGSKTLSSSENAKELSIFQNQYKAKEVINELLDELENVGTPESKQDESRVNLFKSLFNYYLGVVSVETEELSAGENYLVKALQFLDGRENALECCVLAISIRNQLGILWSGRSEHSKACEYLKGASAIYSNYKSSHSDPPIPLTELLLFGSVSDTNALTFQKLDSGFGKCHVYTLYYLAQVYKHLGDSEEAAVHCHKTLKWQIDNNEFDHLEWSLNCAALSQYFICKDNFTAARYLLSCASYMFNQTEPEKCDTEAHQRTRADIARCWAAFGMSLLSVTREKQVPAGENSKKSNGVSQLAETLSEACKIEDYVLVEDDVSSFESKMPSNLVQNYDEAKSVFLATLSCLNEAKEFYTFNEYASDYVSIVQDNSKLYKELTFYETDKERQCKMHKRRADLLEDTLKALNRQFWLAVCRQLLFELGELYNEMMDLKYMLQENDQVSTHAAKKINTLLLKSMTHFFSFINTFKQQEKLPETYPDDYVRPALLAHFYIARLYSKIIYSDPEKCMENLKLSKKYYDYIANYVVKNPDHRQCIEEELQLVYELQELIPQKMQRLVSSTLT